MQHCYSFAEHSSSCSIYGASSHADLILKEDTKEILFAQERERDINGSGTGPKTLLKSKGMDFNCILGIFADVHSPICVRVCY